MVHLKFREWDVEWIKSKRKTYALQIHYSNGIIVRTPLRAKEHEVLELLEQKSMWVERKLLDIQEKKLQAAPLQQSPTHTMYLGKLLRKKMQLHESSKVKIRLSDDELLISLPENCKDIQQHIDKWYKQQASAYLKSRVKHYGSILQLTPQKIWIKSYKRKWGLCRSDGIISFNWKLMFFSAPIVDYVVVHELVHLQIPNHSPQFYKRMQQVLPKYKSAKNYLDSIGVFLV